MKMQMITHVRLHDNGERRVDNANGSEGIPGRKPANPGVRIDSNDEESVPPLPQHRAVFRHRSGRCDGVSRPEPAEQAAGQQLLNSLSADVGTHRQFDSFRDLPRHSERAILNSRESQASIESAHPWNPEFRSAQTTKFRSSRLVECGENPSSQPHTGDVGCHDSVQPVQDAS
jgi:hypothetical protein